MKYLKPLLILIMAITLVFELGDQREAHAILPAMAAAPPIAIGSLEALMAATAAAAAFGIITTAQNQNMQIRLQAAIDSIKESVREGMDMATNAVTEIYEKAYAAIGGNSICEKLESGGGAGSGHSQPCTDGPDVCCRDFIGKFSKLIRKEKGGFTVWKTPKKEQCCLEWDHMHGAFEVFDARGNHMGERGCEDLGENPCLWTESRGRHAHPNSATHGPRSQACRP